MTPEERRQYLAAIRHGFESQFGYAPPADVEQRVLSELEAQAPEDRPTPDEVAGLQRDEQFFAATEYNRFRRDYPVEVTAEAGGESLATFRPDPVVRPDGRIDTGRTDEQGRSIVGQEMTDPRTGETGMVEMIDLGNGIFVPAPPTIPGDEPDIPGFIGGYAEDYVALPPDASSRVMRFANAERLRNQDPTVFAELSTPRPPRYREGQHNSMFAGKDAAYIVEVQSALVAAGFMTEEQAAQERGVWSLRSMDGMAKLMAVSNADGSSWTQKARELARIQAQAEDETGDDPTAGRVYIRPTYREPDYATLSQSVKGLFRRELGRDPFDYEIALFADQLNGDYRSAYEADVAAQMSEFEAGNHALIEAADSGGPVTAGGGTIADVDPVARFIESFESRYADARALNEDREESDVMQTNIANIFSRVNRLMGA